MVLLIIKRMDNVQEQRMENEQPSVGQSVLAFYRVLPFNYRQSVAEHAREIKDRRGEGNNLGNLGIAHGSLGDCPRATECHTQALAIALIAVLWAGAWAYMEFRRSKAWTDDERADE